MTDFSHVLIRASAGTGKTFRLSNRYLGLLHQGVAPDQILATTFTRKAAGEILDRVMVRLAEAALKPDKLIPLARDLDLPHLSQAKCLELLQQLISYLHRLRICTLDAFFAQLAGSFSLELGLPPGWRIVEQLHDKYLRREAIALTLQGDSSREVQRLLHLMAKGEARRSISQLIQSTVDNLYDLYMETEAAAWQRIPKPKPLKDDSLAAAIEVLRMAPLPRDSRASGARDGDVAAAQQRDWERFLGKGLAAKVLDGETTYYKKDIPPETIDAYKTLLGHAKATLLLQVANQTEATYGLLDKFHLVYGQLKHNARALRFGDITRSLAQNIAVGTIERQQFRLDTTICHLLLDEFQDTSLAQWHVLRPFAQNVTSPEVAKAQASGAGSPSFFCVGDVKQAIYGWRGGLSEIFDALHGELAGLVDESMNTSYRSSQPVIDTVNRAFLNMTQHTNLGKFEEGVSLWCKGFREHTTAKKQLRGYAELSTAPAADDEENKNDVKIRYTAQRISQLVTDAPGYSVGVLRSNQVVAHIIYELRQAGLPASEEGGNPLTDSPAVQIILSLLKLADHPGDTIARFHVAHSPLGPLIDFADHQQPDRALALAGDIRSRLLHQGYGPSILHWAELLEPSCDRRDRNRLHQFVELAYGYEPIATLRTTDFLLYVEGERVADPTTAEVRVMTVHQAKGLQFDIVVLPDLDVALTGQADSCVVGQPSPTQPIDRVCLYRNASIQKLLPPQLQELFDTSVRRDVNEAMCVLYVALTRAIHALYMIVTPSAANEKTLHKTPAGLLRAALTNGQRLGAEEIGYRSGDPHWHQPSEPREIGRPAAAAQQAAVAVQLAPMPADSRLDHTAPSQLEGGGRIAAARVLNLGSSIATTRGTLIHALFEQVTWLDETVPEPARLQGVADKLSSAGLSVPQQLDAFQRMLAMPDISAVLRRDFYQPPRAPDLQRAIPTLLNEKRLRLEVHNERRFAVQDQTRLLSGSIDRLVLLYDGPQLVAADIIDYKTDSCSKGNESELDRLVAFYRPQLEAYRRGVATMFCLSANQISARLLFVSAGVARSVVQGKAPDVAGPQPK